MYGTINVALPRRTLGLYPYPAYITAVPMETPHSLVRSSNPSAMSGLLCWLIDSGACACLRRSVSCIQASGRKSWALTGQWKRGLLAGSSAKNSTLTMTWQLPILPRVPDEAIK
nr:hypothetical protein [Dictyobacter formicarum]